MKAETPETDYTSQFSASGYLWAACGVALLLSSFFYTGYYASDDLTYLSSTIALALGKPLGADLASLRFPVLFPASLIYKVSGGSIFLTIYSFVFYHVALVISVYVLGAKAHGRETGVIGAWIIAVSPLLYVFAGSMLPDAALTFWVSIWMIILLKAFSELDAPSRGRWVRLFLLAGFINGVSYSAKESGLILVVPFGLVLIGRVFRQPFSKVLSSGVAYLIGLSIFLLLELLLIFYLTGAWSFRLGIISNEMYTKHLLDLMDKQGTWPLERFMFLYSQLVPFFGRVGIGVVLLAALAYPLIKGRSLLIWIVFIWFVLYQTVGTSSFSMYLAPPLVHRYYAVALLPGALMVAFIWQSALTFIGRRAYPRLGVALAVLMVLFWGSALLGRNLRQAGAIYRAPQVKSFTAAYLDYRERFGEYPVVFSEYTSHRVFPLFDCSGAVYFLQRQAQCNKGGLPDSFIYVQASASYESEFGNYLDAYFGEGKYSISELAVFYPPNNRIEELKVNNAPLLSLLNLPAFKKNPRWAYRLSKVEKITPISAAETQ